MHSSNVTSLFYCFENCMQEESLAILVAIRPLPSWEIDSIGQLLSDILTKSWGSVGHVSLLNDTSKTRGCIIHCKWHMNSVLDLPKPVRLWWTIFQKWLASFHVQKPQMHLILHVFSLLRLFDFLVFQIPLCHIGNLEDFGWSWEPSHNFLRPTTHKQMAKLRF